MIAVSTESGVHFFDYESDIALVKTIPIANVTQVTFIDLYAVLVQESEDATEATLYSYQIGADEPEGRISIRQFMGKKVKVRPSDQSVYFVTGKLIGRIQVPEMELMFQEDSGHEIIDFAAHDTCIFTT